MIITFPIAFQNVAPNLNEIIKNEQEEFHLAHYNIFFTDLINGSNSIKISNWIGDYIKKDPVEIIVEPRIHISSKHQSDGLGSIE